MTTEQIVGVAVVVAVVAAGVMLAWDAIVYGRKWRKLRQDDAVTRAAFDAALRHLDDARRSRARERV